VAEGPPLQIGTTTMGEFLPRWVTQLPPQEPAKSTLIAQENPDRLQAVDGLTYHETARMLIGNTDKKVEQECRGTILVVSAGTSDMPVAEEAAITAEIFGNRVDRYFDVGVAGIHRLYNNLGEIRKARVIIVIAGMEGALPSIVGGLVDKPVIAVPTSIGYGANFNGLSALLGMLTSCASGVCVVNIDNGFGAGYMASMINKI